MSPIDRASSPAQVPFCAMASPRSPCTEMKLALSTSTQPCVRISGASLPGIPPSPVGIVLVTDRDLMPTAKSSTDRQQVLSKPSRVQRQHERARLFRLPNTRAESIVVLPLNAS